MMNSKKIFAGLAALVALSISLAQPAQAQYYTGLLPYPWFKWRGWPLNMLWGQGNYYNGYGYNNNPLYYVNSAVNTVANPYNNGYGGYGYRPYNYYGTRYPTQMQQYQDVEPINYPRVRTKQKRQLPMVVDQTQHAQWQNPPVNQPATEQLAVKPPVVAPVVTGPSPAQRFVDQVNQRHFGNVSSALFDPETRSLARQCGVVNSDDIFDADFCNDRLEEMRSILQDQSLSPEVRAQTIAVLIKHRGPGTAPATSAIAGRQTNTTLH